VTPPILLPRLRTLLLALAATASVAGPGRPALASATMASMVRSFCLSAFQAEMARAGKTPPPGMASFACGCVAEKLEAGSSITDARSRCRDATARRYPI
jgi:hypothetical protein